MSSLRTRSASPADLLGHLLRKEVVGADVARGLEPEDRHLGQDRALVGDRGRQDHVVGGDPVGGDHQRGRPRPRTSRAPCRRVKAEVGEAQSSGGDANNAGRRRPGRAEAAAVPPASDHVRANTPRRYHRDRCRTEQEARIRQRQGRDHAPPCPHRGTGPRDQVDGRRRGLLRRRPDPGGRGDQSARGRLAEAARRPHQPLCSRRGRVGRPGCGCRRSRSCSPPSSALRGPDEHATATAPRARPREAPTARASPSRHGCRCRSSSRRRASSPARSRSSSSGVAGSASPSRIDPWARRGRLPLRSRLDQEAVRGRPRAHDRSRAQHLPRAAARQGIAAAARGRRAPAPAQADAAAVSRRAHARLRGRDPRGDRASDLDLAARRGVRATPEHAGDHARGDPAGRLRRRGRRAPAQPARRPRRDPRRLRLTGRGRLRDPRPAPSCRHTTASRALRQRTDELLHDEIDEHRGDADLGERDDILSMLLGATSRTARRWATASCATSS